MEKLNKRLDNTSRKLIKALRHDPESLDLILDDSGYVFNSQIIEKLDIRPSELLLIINNDDKQRFELNENRNKVRASQGHSIDIDETSMKELSITELIKKTYMYHGTSKENLKSILKDGIFKMNRNFVHLSKDIETANTVAERHKKDVIILKIDLSTVYNSNCKIYESSNGVILCKHVSPSAIKEIIDLSNPSTFETESIIYSNRLLTPDGTILHSTHVHDYIVYKDKSNNKEYCVDGGNEYLKRSVNGDEIDLSIFDRCIYEVKREHVKWGTRGKDGKSELTLKSLSELSNDHIFNIIKTQQHISYRYFDLLVEELKYRKLKDIEIED
jgi:putative RNA 2'-phosphotransferase